MFNIAQPLLRGWVSVFDHSRAQGVQTVSSISGQARFHRGRAESFNAHATNTKNPGTREMYLRLAGREVALAEQFERLEDQARERADQQARVDAEVELAALG